MKIAQSSVLLASTNKYHEENVVGVSSSVMTRGNFRDNLEAQKKTAEAAAGTSEQTDKSKKAENSCGNYESLFAPVSNGELALGSENYNSLKPTKSAYLRPQDASLEEQIMAIRASLLEQILKYMQLLGGDSNKVGASSNNVSGLSNKVLGYRSMLDDMSSLLSSGSMVSVTNIQTTHIEEEEVSFQSTGIAITEDGRSIDFGVSFSMSSRLVDTTGITYARPVNFIDPLVINVSSDVTSISDQSFFFDLDCDGEEDEISFLGAGSGFLAYDKNGDGRIGDGSELFGTKNGDGFKDLAAYDLDGNGWIDENDEIYGKLQVWLRGEDGTDTLLSLKEADVGAIYLGRATTECSMRDSNFNAAARLRASGIFLRESGSVGTVQHVDLAAKVHEVKLA